MRTRAHAVFRGRVQGVNFRAYCRESALELGLTGWVRNLPDGTVEVVLEGEKDHVEAALNWNRTSQPHAKVTDVEIDWGSPSGEFRTFEIRR